MNQTASPNDSSAPEANPRHWTSHGNGRIWYPVLVGLNVLLVSFLFFYIRRIMSKEDDNVNNGDDTDGSSDSESSSTVMIMKLHPDVLSPLSVFVYSAAGEETFECAVCLAEFRDAEEGRQLPRCGHRFHVACVDVWLRSHTTCPICRSSMEQTSTTAAATEPEEAV